MAKVIIGSAHSDERGKLSGGKAGDQKQPGSGTDYKGEVSLENFYHHKKGWYVLRLSDPTCAEACAKAMLRACNNSNIGYDQNQRLGIIKYGTDTTIKTECDCSSLVRQCIIEACGVDPGNFTTADEASVLKRTRIFEATKEYKNGMELYNGDILVTKSKGHTVIVVTGKPRIETAAPSTKKYYRRYVGTSDSIVDALITIGANASMENRKKIAIANGITKYTGTAKQNLQLLDLLKNGILIKP